MKFTALLLLATCLQLQANTYAQSITLKVKNSPLEFVLGQLKKQSGYQFFYKDAALRDAKPVTLEVSNRPTDTFTGGIDRTATLTELLTILEMTGLRFKLEGRKLTVLNGK